LAAIAIAHSIERGRWLGGRHQTDETKMTASHVPVMVREVLDFLSPAPGAVSLDTTLGGGGHSFAVLEAIQPSGVLIGCDRDVDAVKVARRRLAPFGSSAHLHHAHHSKIKEIVAQEGFDGVDSVLFDLGISSIQLESPGRGFRMDSSDALDMRMDQGGGPTAADLVNALTEKDLADLIYGYGEERNSRAIARAIGKARVRKPLERCDELAALVVSVAARRSGTRGKRWRIHPATRTFQALRIAVNRELDTLESALCDAVELLRPGGRIAVISFHSLEDRVVKNAFRELGPGNDKRGSLEILTRRVVRPSVEEVKSNPRSRSAKLRVGEKR